MSLNIEKKLVNQANPTLAPRWARFAADKKAQGFLDPICMGMWENESLLYILPLLPSLCIYYVLI